MSEVVRERVVVAESGLNARSVDEWREFEGSRNN